VRSVTPERVTSTLPSPPPTDKKIQKHGPSSSDPFIGPAFEVMTPLSKFRQLESEVHVSFPSLSSQVQSLSTAFSTLRDSTSILPSIRDSLDSLNREFKSSLSVLQEDHKVLQENPPSDFFSNVESLEDRIDELQNTVSKLLPADPPEYWTREHLSSLGFSVFDSFPSDDSLTIVTSHLRALFPKVLYFSQLQALVFPNSFTVLDLSFSRQKLIGKYHSQFSLSSSARYSRLHNNFSWLKTRLVAVLDEKRFYLSASDYAYELIYHCYQWLYLETHLSKLTPILQPPESCSYSLPVPGNVNYPADDYHVTRGGITVYRAGQWVPFFTSDLMGSQLVKKWAVSGRRNDFYLRFSHS